MRYLFLHLLIFCVFNTAHAGIRTMGINIHRENTSLDKVFKEIEKQTGYCFFYDTSLVKPTDKVTIQITDGTIHEVLEACLLSLGLEYRIAGRIITFKEREHIEREEGGLTHYYIIPVVIPFGSRKVRKILKKLVGKWLKKSDK